MSTVSHDDHHDHHEHEIASKIVFGFWVYLMTDAIMFAALFATYAVLHNNTYGGIGIAQIAPLSLILHQSVVLLTSVFTFGLCSLSAHKGKLMQTRLWLIITFVLGALFVMMEKNLFAQLIDAGHTWQGSAFLSSYFTLVGLHWFHVIVGLVWMLLLFIQLGFQGLSFKMNIRFTCLGLFWSYLNIIWVFIFTIVYLTGAI